MSFREGARSTPAVTDRAFSSETDPPIIQERQHSYRSIFISADNIVSSLANNARATTTTTTAIASRTTDINGNIITTDPHGNAASPARPMRPLDQLPQQQQQDRDERQAQGRSAINQHHHVTNTHQQQDQQPENQPHYLNHHHHHHRPRNGNEPSQHHNHLHHHHSHHHNNYNPHDPHRRYLHPHDETVSSNPSPPSIDTTTLPYISMGLRDFYQSARHVPLKEAIRLLESSHKQCPPNQKEDYYEMDATTVTMSSPHDRSSLPRPIIRTRSDQSQPGDPRDTVTDGTHSLPDIHRVRQHHATCLQDLLGATDPDLILGVLEENPDLDFVFLSPTLPPSHPEYSPYLLHVVMPENIDILNYCMVSRLQAIRYTKGHHPSIQSLDRWKFEQRVLAKLKKIPFFRNFRKMKVFYALAGINLDMRLVARFGRRLRTHLFTSDPILADTLVLGRTMSLDMAELAMVNIDWELTYSLGEFMEEQSMYLREKSTRLERYLTILTHLTLSSCWDDVISAGLAEEAGRDGGPTPRRTNEIRKKNREKKSKDDSGTSTKESDHGVHKGRWREDVLDSVEKQEERRQRCTRLARFVYLMDCIIQNALHTVCLNSLKKTEELLRVQKSTFPSVEGIKNIVRGYCGHQQTPRGRDEDDDDSGDDEDGDDNDDDDVDDDGYYEDVDEYKFEEETNGTFNRDNNRYNCLGGKADNGRQQGQNIGGRVIRPRKSNSKKRNKKVPQNSIDNEYRHENNGVATTPQDSSRNPQSTNGYGGMQSQPTGNITSDTPQTLQHQYLQAQPTSLSHQERLQQLNHHQQTLFRGVASIGPNPIPPNNITTITNTITNLNPTTTRATATAAAGGASTTVPLASTTADGTGSGTPMEFFSLDSREIRENPITTTTTPTESSTSSSFSVFDFLSTNGMLYYREYALLQDVEDGRVRGHEGDLPELNPLENVFHSPQPENFGTANENSDSENNEMNNEIDGHYPESAIGSSISLSDENENWDNGVRVSNFYTNGTRNGNNPPRRSKNRANGLNHDSEAVSTSGTLTTLATAPNNVKYNVLNLTGSDALTTSSSTTVTSLFNSGSDFSDLGNSPIKSLENVVESQNVETNLLQLPLTLQISSPLPSPLSSQFSSHLHSSQLPIPPPSSLASKSGAIRTTSTGNRTVLPKIVKPKAHESDSQNRRPSIPTLTSEMTSTSISSESVTLSDWDDDTSQENSKPNSAGNDHIITHTDTHPSTDHGKVSSPESPKSGVLIEKRSPIFLTKCSAIDRHSEFEDEASLSTSQKLSSNANTSFYSKMLKETDKQFQKEPPLESSTSICKTPDYQRLNSSSSDNLSNGTKVPVSSDKTFEPWLQRFIEKIPSHSRHKMYPLLDKESDDSRCKQCEEVIVNKTKEAISYLNSRSRGSMSSQVSSDLDLDESIATNNVEEVKLVQLAQDDTNESAIVNKSERSSNQHIENVPPQSINSLENTSKFGEENFETYFFSEGKDGNVSNNKGKTEDAFSSPKHIRLHLTHSSPGTNQIVSSPETKVDICIAINKSPQQKRSCRFSGDNRTIPIDEASDLPHYQNVSHDKHLENNCVNRDFRNRKVYNKVINKGEIRNNKGEGNKARTELDKLHVSTDSRTSFQEKSDYHKSTNISTNKSRQLSTQRKHNIIYHLNEETIPVYTEGPKEDIMTRNDMQMKKRSLPKSRKIEDNIDREKNVRNRGILGFIKRAIGMVNEGSSVDSGSQYPSNASGQNDEDFQGDDTGTTDIGGSGGSSRRAAGGAGGGGGVSDAAGGSGSSGLPSSFNRRTLKPAFHISLFQDIHTTFLTPDAYDFVAMAYTIMNDIEKTLQSFSPLTQSPSFRSFTNHATTTYTTPNAAVDGDKNDGSSLVVTTTREAIRGPSLEHRLTWDAKRVDLKNSIYDHLDSMFHLMDVFVAEMNGLYCRFFQPAPHSITMQYKDIRVLETSLKRLDSQIKILERLPDCQRVGMFLIDLSPYRDTLKHLSATEKDVVYKDLNQEINGRIHLLIMRIADVMDVLESQPLVTDCQFRLLSFIDHGDFLMAELEKKEVPVIASMYDLIDRYGLPHDTANREEFESCHSSIDVVKSLQENLKLTKRDELVKGLEYSLARDEAWVESQVNKVIRPLTKNPFLQDGTTHWTTVERLLGKAEVSSVDLVAKANFIRRVQRYIRKPESEFTELFRTIASYTNLRNAWLLLKDWETKMQGWKTMEFVQLDVARLNFLVFQYMEACRKLSSRLQANTVLQVLEDKMDLMLRWLNFIIEFRSASIKPRHWLQVQEILGVEFGESLPLTLGNLMTLKATEKQKVLHMVLNRARVESNIQSDFDEVVRQCHILVIPIQAKERTLISEEPAVKVYQLADSFQLEEALNYLLMELERIDMSQQSGFLHTEVELQVHQIFEVLETLVLWTEFTMKLGRLRRLVLRNAQFSETHPESLAKYKSMYLSHSELLGRMRSNPLAFEWCMSRDVTEFLQANQDEAMKLIYRLRQAQQEAERDAERTLGEDRSEEDSLGNWIVN